MMPIERSVPAMVKRALCEFDVAFGRLHQMRSGLLAFFDHERGSLHDRLTRRRDRARAAGCVAEADEIAVALLQCDLLEGNAELRRQHLRERRAWPWP